MKYLLSLFFTIFSMGSNYADIPLGREYVSIDCPKGDITLLLNKDGQFSLELKHWDSKQNKHTHIETLTGDWKLLNKRLTLFAGSKLEFVRKPSAMSMGGHSDNIDGFEWRYSSKPTFADTFALVERKAVDALFERMMPK